MRRSTFNFSSVALLVFGLALATPTVLAQMRGGSAPGGQNGSNIGQSGMSPNMQPNGPMAPQNNEQLIEQNTFGSMRRNLEVETDLSKMALKNSQNADIKKFAQQVITDNHVLQSHLNVSASNGQLAFAGEVPSQTRQAEKQMKKLTGQPFDQMYLVQMDGYVKNDQQTARSAAAMMSLPEVSDVGMRMRTMAESREQQIAKLTQEAHFKIE